VIDSAILAERRVRSSELALHAARRRLRDADEEIAELAARVEELEGALLVQAAERAAEPEALREAVAVENRARRVAEQQAHAERIAREEAVAELERAVASQRAPLAVERELAAALAREQALEAELEIVRRRAADVEHSASVALAAMRQELRESAGRVARALAQLEAVEGPREDAPRLATVSPDRLDEALERLRAQTPVVRAQREAAPEPTGWLRRAFSR
jgi:dTMP kinase